MNDTEPLGRDQASTTETHEFQFRGTFVPAGVLYLLRDKKISTTDLLLLILVDSYTKYGGHGCFAHNAYLASQLRVSPLWVSEGVSKLKRMGLLRSYTANGKRHLVTVWGRICDDSEQNNSSGANHTHPMGANHTITNTLQIKEKLSARQDKVDSKPESTTQDGADSMNPMFPELAPVKGKRIDTTWAEQLRATLVKARVAVTGCKIHKWADQFRLLRQSVPDYTRIEDVLDWYSANVGKKYTPVVECAKAFRLKFAKLEASMQREHQAHPTISSDAEGIARRLRRLGWTNGSESQLGAACQSSLEAFRHLRAQVSVPRGKTLYNRLAGFLDYVKRKLNVRPEDFVEQWLTDINRKRCDWDGWDGNLMRDAFSLEHKLFASRGKSWAVEYAGRSSLWDELVEVLK